MRPSGEPISTRAAAVSNLARKDKQGGLSRPGARQPGTAVALLIMLLAGAAEIRAQEAFAGVWRAGTDAHYLWVGKNWNDFKAKWEALAKQNFRLVDLETYVEGNQRKYAGVWRSGSDGHYLWVGVEWNNFKAKWEELAKQNLRLIDFETYVDGGKRLYAGAWRAGNDGHFLWVGVDWNDFKAKWEELAKQNLRLIDFETYLDGGQRKYAGVWRAGNDGHFLWVGVDWNNFKAKWNELNNQNLRLIDFKTYLDGGQRKYAGVWRAGNDGHYLWVGVDFENFKAKWHELAGQGLRLIRLVTYAGCEAGCANQVVADTAYDYGITAHDTVYHWPVDKVAADKYARLSALQFSDAPFILPFSDQGVKRWNGWLYSPGKWHHAHDYGIDLIQSFQVKAAAPGKVVFIGWDNWSGNTIVISHNAGGVQDAYRTIYMHMRNGPLNDCAKAWSGTLTDPNIGVTEKNKYKDHLNQTGCPQRGTRTPGQFPDHWGTDSQAISVSVNQQVVAGQLLGWAGGTGPGGQLGGGSPTAPNTHLHIFFTRRDPSNNKWYFIDPYGIYGPPSCYPSSTTGSIGGACARYPNAWKGGHPQYP